MANIYFYPDELEPLIEDIINDGRDALFVAFARMTDIERKKILSQSESTFCAAKSYMERNGKIEYIQKLNAHFGGDRYLKLCLAIGHSSLHKRLSGAETALAVEQRQQLRNVRRRRKTQKEKILSVCAEIHQLKRQGRTWSDICYWLRTAHRKLFQDSSLNLRYLKRVYAAWKSSVQGNVPNDAQNVVLGLRQSSTGSLIIGGPDGFCALAALCFCFAPAARNCLISQFAYFAIETRSRKSPNVPRL